MTIYSCLPWISLCGVSMMVASAIIDRVVNDREKPLSKGAKRFFLIFFIIGVIITGSIQIGLGFTDDPKIKELVGTNNELNEKIAGLTETNNELNEKIAGLTETISELEKGLANRYKSDVLREVRKNRPKPMTLQKRIFGNQGAANRN